MKGVGIAFIFWLFFLSGFAQAPSVEIWDRRFGGTNEDGFYSFQQTRDSGYILGGWSVSEISGDKTQNCWGGMDYWVVKINASGNKEWDKRFGGFYDDNFWVLQQTFDNGYILTGFSASDSGGDKTQNCWGGMDYWLVKIDSIGNKQWDKDYGGTNDDLLYCMQQTSDGGYILGGTSYSGIGGDKTQPNWDNTLQTPDYWVVKIDSLGNKQWDKRFGGTNTDQLLSLIQTNDGGYLLGGTTESDSGADVSQPPFSWIDYWVVKIDSFGNKQWDRRFGGAPETGSEFSSLLQATDGGYILGGYTAADSGGDKSQNTFGNEDYWIIKIDSVGNKQWDKDYGGPGDDELTNMSLTSDGGYLFSGNSAGDADAGGAAGGDKSENNMAYSQTWIVKTDIHGNKQWDKTILTIDNNGGYAIQLNDNCYAIAAATVSGIGGYKTQPNWDASDSTGDYWIVKFCFTGTPETVDTIPKPVDTLFYDSYLQLNVYPNPFSSELDIFIAQQNLSQATFKICNLLGQTIYSQQETNLSNTYTKMLDLSYLAKGVYVVEVVVNGERLERKVVKQ